MHLKEIRSGSRLKRTMKEFCVKKNISMSDYVESLISKSLRKN